MVEVKKAGGIILEVFLAISIILFIVSSAGAFFLEASFIKPIAQDIAVHQISQYKSLSEYYINFNDQCDSAGTETITTNFEGLINNININCAVLKANKEKEVSRIIKDETGRLFEKSYSQDATVSLQQLGPLQLVTKAANKTLSYIKIISLILILLFIILIFLFYDTMGGRFVGIGMTFSIAGTLGLVGLNIVKMRVLGSISPTILIIVGDLIVMVIKYLLSQFLITLAIGVFLTVEGFVFLANKYKNRKKANWENDNKNKKKEGSD